MLGEMLGRRRDQVVLATKFGRGDMGYGPAAGAKGGRSYIRRAVTNRCGGCGPTTSTCTSCTRRIR